MFLQLSIQSVNGFYQVILGGLCGCFMQFIAVLSDPTVGRSVSFIGEIIGFISAVYFSVVVVL